MLTLNSARRKVDHARLHFERLDRELREFKDHEPFLLREFEEDGNVQVRAIVREPVPDEVSLFLGDCLHNLRASLDHIVYEAVGKSPARCEWPMPNHDGKLPRDWDKRVKEKCPGGGYAAGLRRYIHTLDPSVGGSDQWLWVLHRLDIIDKHRLLLAVCAATDRVRTVQYVDGYGVSANNPGQMTHLPDIGELDVTWIPAVRYPLEDGTVIQEVTSAEWSKVKSINLSVSAAIGEDSMPVSGKPIEEVAKGLLDKVYGLLVQISQVTGLGKP